MSDKYGALIEKADQKLIDINSLIKQYSMPRISREGQKSGDEILQQARQMNDQFVNSLAMEVSGFAGTISR